MLIIVMMMMMIIIMIMMMIVGMGIKLARMIISKYQELLPHFKGIILTFLF